MAVELKQLLKKCDALIAESRFEAAYELLNKSGSGLADTLNQVFEMKIRMLHCCNRLYWAVESSELVNFFKKSKAGMPNEDFEIGQYYTLIGNTNAAEKYLKKAVRQRNSKLYWSELAIIQEQSGNIADAQPIYEKILLNAMKTRSIGEVEARILNRLTGIRVLTESEESFLKSVFDGADYPISIRNRVGFALAKHYRKSADIDREIETLKRVNESELLIRKEAGVFFDQAEAKRKTRLIANKFDQPTPAWMGKIAGSDKQYIYILGMPRSGTTLLEQILGAHSRVGNCGESHALSIALKKVTRSYKPNSPESRYKLLDKVDELTSADLSSIVRSYVTYQQLFSKKNILTDKALMNITWVGLLANLFPKSVFVYIARNPLDNAVSIYQQDFSYAEYSYRPEDCVAQYLEYLKIARYWKSFFPERFYTIKYEALVADFRGEIGKLLDFVGLNWEDKLLRFNERENSVRTPSAGQVRQSLNNSAVDKWRRYEAILKPARLLIEKNDALLAH